MNNTLIIILLFLFVLLCSAKVLIQSDLKVKITSIAKCTSSGQYPVEIYNVAVNIDNGKITVAGTLTASVDLTSPIEATLKVEKKELGVWIKIPCVDSIGSCTYNDLCIYGVPSSGSCPESFISNNVPCRCPIPKGNYTIPSSLQFNIYPNSNSPIYYGNYWAKVNILNKNKNLACYEVYFTLGDSIPEEEDEINIDYSNYMDRIFVTLV